MTPPWKTGRDKKVNMHKLTIRPGGVIDLIYQDAFRSLMDQGQSFIRRASHVEPGDPAKQQDPLLWYADLAPCGGPVLGGFVKRAEALEAEAIWIQKHIL